MLLLSFTAVFLVCVFFLVRKVLLSKDKKVPINFLCFYFLKKSNIILNKFKNRRLPYYSDVKFFFGDSGLFTNQQFRFESVYFRFLKKILRKKYRKKKILFSTQKYWIKFNKNTLLSKKSKNARMGSGKGKYLRYAYSIQPNTSFVETRGFNKKYLTSLNYRIRLKIPAKLRVLHKTFCSFFLN